MNDYIQTVYEELKSRKIHPSGNFDAAGRWYTIYPHLIDVRMPSAKYPLSEMKACRTRKYVRAVANEFACDSVETLRLMV